MSQEKFLIEIKMRSEGSRSNYLKIEHVMTVWNLIHAPAVTASLDLELIKRGSPAHFDFYLEPVFWDNLLDNFSCIKKFILALTKWIF